MMRSLAIIALLFLNLSDARVTFPNSEVLQAVDLGATDKASFKCKNTCKAYADRNSDKLMITQNGRIIATFDTIIGTNAYAGLGLAPGDYVLENRGTASPEFVFYVVDSTARNFVSPVLALQETVGTIRNQSPDRYVTVLSSFDAVQFSQLKGTFPNGYPRIYSTGYDAAGMVQCYPAYQSRSPSNALNSLLTIPSAVTTVDFGYTGDHSVAVNRATNQSPMKSGFSSTVYTSPGYVGCSFTSGQNYYSNLTVVEDSFSVDATNLDSSASYYLADNEPVQLTINNDIMSMNGSGVYSGHQSYVTTFNVSVSWERATPGGSFALQLDFTTSIVSSTKASTPTTTDSQPPKAEGYCNCAVDKFGWYDGWNPQQIWLDIVIVLDRSEAMGDNAVDDACTLIESLFGANNYDQLITDPSAAFYTRVGLMAMTDSAEVLYNLNMTKADTLGHMGAAKGVKNIDVMDAFTQAQQMLADGIKSTPSRASTRQVIYYFTNSDAVVNSVVLDQFKQGGTIVVNHIKREGEAAKPGLKQLASTGYYYDDIENNYLSTLQVFCKANCFCSPDLTPYNDSSSDAAIIAAGGCYHARAAGVQFSKAASSCAESRDGLIASVHDAAKGDFLNELMMDATHKKYYYWIGFSKGADGRWEWEDNSTADYYDWDTNEPSEAAVARCAYVDQSQESLP